MPSPISNTNSRSVYLSAILGILIVLLLIDYFAIHVVSEKSDSHTPHLIMDILSILIVGTSLYVVTHRYQKKIEELTNTTHLLDENQRFLNLTQRIGQLAHWKLDLEKSRIDWSKEAALILGIPEENLDYRLDSLLERVHPEDKDTVLNAYRACFEKFTPFHILFRLDLHGSGLPDKWITAAGSPQYDEKDQPTGFIGTIQDTTEQIEKQQSIDESKNQFKRVFDSVADAIYIADIKGNILEVNEQGLRELGLSREEILKLNVLDLDPTVPIKGGETLLRQQWEESMQTGKIISYEGMHRRSDESLFPVGMRLRATYFQGQPALIGVARNLTDIKKNEELLRIQTQALEVAENVIIITDTDGVIQWVNEAFEKLTGYNREEAIGQHPSILKSGEHPVSIYESLWNDILNGVVWRGELQNRKKDGTLYKANVIIAPIRNEKGRISHFVSIQQDITKISELEEQFQRSQRMETIGLLAGGIAHDLNNVLAPIMMSLPLLKEEPLSDSSQELIKTIDSCLNRGSDIIRQVLTFSRGMQGERIIVQTRHLLKEVVSMIKETFPKNISIRLYAKSDMWCVNGDPTQLQQVFLNLAVNARDAMPNGGELSIHGSNVTLTKPEKFLNMNVGPGSFTCVEFVDQGDGMDEKTINKIFEPFFTTKPQGKGTGLGLPTVLGIIRSHSGLIRVASKPGKGSRFTIYLPAETSSIVELEPETISQNVPGAGETILIVDDESNIRNTVKLGLKKGNYTATEAGNGKEALEVLQQHSNEIKLIITDRMMPVMDGDTFARQARQLFPNIPIVGMSGAMDQPESDLHPDPGSTRLFDAYLIKPFSRDLLLSTVQNALTEIQSK